MADAGDLLAPVNPRIKRPSIANHDINNKHG
jgi:hypothetical protein